MSLPDLVLPLEDKIMFIEKVNIVFHVAATVAFNQPLNEAVNLITKDTSRVIELCKELMHVISFIYVSTANNRCFYNAYLPEIGEKVYT